jgi:hypothetical protein
LRTHRRLLQFSGKVWGEKDAYSGPEDVIDKLIAEHMPDRSFQFGSDEFNSLAEATYARIGSPGLEVGNAWNIWRIMMDIIDGLSAL